MHGKRGGQVMARHALHVLKANARKASLASGVARRRRKAEQEQACQIAAQGRLLAALPSLQNELEERWQRLREETQPPRRFLAM